MPVINITIEPTSNENIVKFVANTLLLQSQSFEFNTIEEAKQSPIAQQLFHFPFVKTIYLTQNFIAIEKYDQKTSKVTWEEVQEDVSMRISEYLNEGKSVITNVNIKSKVPITIYAESTPNPAVMKFVANKALVNGTFEFKNSDEATHAPIVQSLFNFPFVKEVFMNANYISITKNGELDWQDFIIELREFIRKYIENGNKILSDEILQKQKILSSHTNLSEQNSNEFTRKSDKNKPPLTSIDKEIIAILDKYIKPAVTEDGGNIAFESYDENTKTVRVILQGACSGCPSSTVTLKNGIEALLKEMLIGKVNFVEAINA